MFITDRTVFIGICSILFILACIGLVYEWGILEQCIVDVGKIISVPHPLF